ncbi:hypothetical protein [Patulibacter defluvii]|uniref:hypothetical protein n=1 Tax=Patulibacter defluvii TaxID=3095358 RepID=UPI002A7515C0|nr:hypothetical protein [Patulibacter sp. DM4]
MDRRLDGRPGNSRAAGDDSSKLVINQRGPAGPQGPPGEAGAALPELWTYGPTFGRKLDPAVRVESTAEAVGGIQSPAFELPAGDYQLTMSAAPSGPAHAMVDCFFAINGGSPIGAGRNTWSADANLAATVQVISHVSLEQPGTVRAVCQGRLPNAPAGAADRFAVAFESVGVLKVRRHGAAPPILP